MAVRTLAVVCPRWAPTAAGVAPDVPAATFHANRVVSATRSADGWGIRRGLRRREAQARCPELVVLDHDEARDMRAFEPVIQAVEAFTPRVEVVRSGVCVLEVRGPSRYFGSEQRLAGLIREAVDALGLPAEPCRTGIADGPFAAEIAAFRGVAVPEGGTPAFLAPAGVRTLGLDALADLLVRLGIHTLGDLAALPERDVVARFGAQGRWAHRMACGDDDRLLAPRPPGVDLTARRELEEPLHRVDEAMFVGKALADELIDRLAGLGLACARIRIEISTEHGESRSRVWRYSAAFTPAAIAERVRWQLEGWLTAGASQAPTGGVTLLELVPEDVGSATGAQHGLWGRAEVSDRVRRSLDRVQAMLGHEGVLVPVLSGGRGPGEHVHLVPWGEPVEPARPGLPGERHVSGPVAVELPPWPGRLPAPSPARVLEQPAPAEVVDDAGRAVRVTGRLELSASPCRVRTDGRWAGVSAWAGPWGCDERWWDPQAGRRMARLQVTLDDGTGMLLFSQAGGWRVEAVYD